MVQDEVRVRFVSVQQAQTVKYLVVCLNRLNDKSQEWQPVALAALRQRQLGHLSVEGLVELLTGLERLCWMFLLCKTPVRERGKRWQQVSWVQ